MIAGEGLAEWGFLLGAVHGGSPSLLPVLFYFYYVGHGLLVYVRPSIGGSHRGPFGCRRWRPPA